MVDFYLLCVDLKSVFSAGFKLFFVHDIHSDCRRCHNSYINCFLDL